MNVNGYACSCVSFPCLICGNAFLPSFSPGVHLYLSSGAYVTFLHAFSDFGRLPLRLFHVSVFSRISRMAPLENSVQWIQEVGSTSLSSAV